MTMSNLRPLDVELALTELSSVVDIAKKSAAVGKQIEHDTAICLAAREAFQTFLDKISIARKYSSKERDTLERALAGALEYVRLSEPVKRSIRRKLEAIHSTALDEFLRSLETA